MPGIDLLSNLLSEDPFFSYTLIAALFLAVVSLSAGLFRLDFLVSFRPRALLHISLAVLLAFMLVFLADYARGHTIGQPWLSMLNGLSRLPLYVIALAYGPSAGLLAGLLFAGFAATGSSPGWPEIIVSLELCVLGWFAIAPSAFRVAWAGPANAAFAYTLTWIAAGSAYLQWHVGGADRLSTHLNFHAEVVPGVLLSLLLLFLVRPGFYQRHFYQSRIAPQWVTTLPNRDVFVELPTEDPTPLRHRRHSTELSEAPQNPSPFLRARPRRQLQPAKFDELRRQK